MNLKGRITPKILPKVTSNNKAKEKGVYKGKNRLTPEELEHYRRDNQCFKCGEQEHLYQTCPQRNARNEQPRASTIEAPIENFHCKGSPLSYAWGKVREHDSFILFGLGSTHNFFSHELAAKLGIQEFEMGDAMKVERAFIGQDVSTTPLIGKLRLHIQGHVDKEDFFISPLKHEDAILGAPWFDRLAASIKFPERKISFKFREKDMYIVAQESGSTIPLVNDQAFDKSIKSSISVYMICVKESLSDVKKTQVIESGMHEELELSKFLNQFQDVFIDDISRELPPKREDDDHAIKLIPDSSPPNKPPYRVSQAQQEEIMRHVNESIEKGMGRRLKPCSTKKGIRCLQKACLHLREKFEEEFGFDESSDDEDDEWEYLMGVSTSQGKGVQVGGVSQRSHQEPIDTLKPTSKIPPNAKILHHTHLNNQHDDENMCESKFFASNGLNFESSACKSNKVSAQSTQLGDHSDVAKAIIFASFFDLLGQNEITNSMHASTYQDRAENEQKSEYPELEDDPKTMSEEFDSNSDVTQQTLGFLHFAMQGPSSKLDEGMFTNFEAYFSQMEDRTYFPECQQELAEMQDIDLEFFEVFMEFLATENDCESAQIEEEFIDLFVLPPNSNFHDVFTKELEQTNIEPQAYRINYLLNLKIQENGFLEPNSDIQYFKDFQDQISMFEVYFDDFLNDAKVANQILQTRYVRANDSMIHISYCLHQILQIDDQIQRGEDV
ncbi:hypothetical protein L7F22_011437 [Adiantum nelumboides]|nr:hypothetical protein [Adiantum nelumboides]